MVCSCKFNFASSLLLVIQESILGYLSIWSNQCVFYKFHEGPCRIILSILETAYSLRCRNPEHGTHFFSLSILTPCLQVGRKLRKKLSPMNIPGLGFLKVMGIWCVRGLSNIIMDPTEKLGTILNLNFWGSTLDMNRKRNGLIRFYILMYGLFISIGIHSIKPAPITVLSNGKAMSCPRRLIEVAWWNTFMKNPSNPIRNSILPST